MSKEKKSYQIKMVPGAHATTKYRAKQLGITIGDLIGNHSALLEIRLKRLFEDADFSEKDLNTSLEREIIKKIFKFDQEGRPYDDLVGEVKLLVNKEFWGNAEKNSWKPEIILPE